MNAREADQRMIAPPIAAAIRPYVGRLVVLALFSLAASGADIALSLTFRHLIDRVVRADQDIWRGVAFVVVLVLGLGAVKTAARMAIRTTSEAVGQGVALDLRVTLYSHLLRLPLAFFHQREVGRILVRFVSDLNAIRRFVSNGVSVALADGLAVICLVAATLVIDWRLGVGFLLVGPVEAIAVRRFNAPLRALNLTIRGQRARLSGLIQDSLSGIEAIKAYGREGKESARVARRSRKMRRDTLAQARVAAGAEGVSEALHAAATAYVLGVGGWLVMSGQMTTGTLVAFYSLFHHLAPAVRRLVRANEIAQTSRVQMGRVAAFLAREPEPASPDAVDADPSRRRSIVAHGVDGRWSFTALPGEIVAIVGPTGSGKSTLAGYLMGFGRPRSGRLTIDETDVSTTSPAALRAMVAWVTGDASLFRGSLVKNVRLGAPAASAVDIEAAVRASTLDRVAERLEAGLQHRVGSGGRRLSRGERALVSVARALLVQRPILILDDPFTGLDTETVDQIWGALEARRPSATTVIFTTDAAIAGRADRVFLLARAPDSHQPSTQPSEPIETL